MNPTKRQRLTQFSSAALALFILLTPFQLLRASEGSRATRQQQQLTRSQEPAGSAPVLSPEKRQKLHRLDPEDLFGDSNTQDAGKGESSRLKRRDRRKRNRQERAERNAETEAAETTQATTTPSPLPMGNGFPNAPLSLTGSSNVAASPPSTAAASGQAAIPPVAAVAVEPRVEQPDWLLPLVAAIFLAVLGALVLVLGKLNKILRGTGT